LTNPSAFGQIFRSPARSFHEFSSRKPQVEANHFPKSCAGCFAGKSGKQFRVKRSNARLLWWNEVRRALEQSHNIGVAVIEKEIKRESQKIMKK
jgi:hypothetical protein